MPNGAGFFLRGGACYFGQIEVELPMTVALRVEVRGDRAHGFINDEEVAAAALDVPSPREPGVALFDYADGPRPYEPGYEMALKRSQERGGANAHAKDERSGD